MIEKLNYRPEIDGLRAVAVTAVVLFHADFGCPGGFVGVDIFFVISGYLITSLIWQDLAAGNFSMIRFWEKRSRRIVPALVAVTSVTLVAGVLLLFPDDLVELGWATASQSLFGANVHYWLTSGYFEHAADEKPLLHTWSLAVEEQFYGIVPWLLCGLFFFRRLRQRPVVLLILGVLTLFSLAISVYGVAHSPSATFYLLPTRAWELLIGTMVAFLPLPAWWPRVRPLRELLGGIGLLLIMVPIFVYGDKTPFPGLAALPPCMGAALLIVADRQKVAGLTTMAGKLLSRPLCVFVGLISYSLYLWHWPFFAFAEVLSLEPLSAGLRALLLAGGIMAAVLSWKFIETPFRRKAIGRTRRSMFAWATGGLGLVTTAGLSCIVASGLPQRYSQPILARLEAVDDKHVTPEMTVEDVRGGRFVALGRKGAGGQPRLLVWGDSHAAAALPAIDELLQERGLFGQAATHSSTLPVADWFVATKWGLGEKSLEFSQEILQYVAREKISDVLMIAYWRGYNLGHKEAREEFEQAFVTTIERIGALGARPWVLLDVPVHPFYVPKATAHSFYSPEYIASLCATPQSLATEGANSPSLITKIQAAGGRVLDPKPMFLSASGEYYRVFSDETLLYRDEHHLTTRGAKLVLLPFLRNAMPQIGASAQ